MGIFKLVFVAIALLLMIGLAFGLVKYLERKRSGGDAPEKADRPGEPPRYRRREWLLDARSELQFFHTIERALTGIPGSWRVMVQMPLSRLIEPEKGLAGGERQRCQNKIDRKTVDFVVCESTSLKAMCAVELDGSSHDREKTKARDGFVEAALKGAGVTLVRFDRRGKEWGADEVRERLTAVLGVRASKSSPVAASGQR